MTDCCDPSDGDGEAASEDESQSCPGSPMFEYFKIQVINTPKIH